MAQAVHDGNGGGLVASLRTELDLFVSGFDARPATKAMLDGSADRDLYVGFLAQSHHYVTLSEPYLRAAGNRMRELGQHQVLADLFLQKANEESGHETLIDDDIRALGLDPKKVLSEQRPGGWVSAYNTWIRAATSGDHPSAYFGSAYVLEGLATHRAGPLARALRSAGRIGKIDEATSFLQVHAEEDIGHVEELEHMLAGIDDAVETDAIAVTAAATRCAYLGMLDDVAGAQRHAA